MTLDMRMRNNMFRRLPVEQATGRSTAAGTVSAWSTGPAISSCSASAS